MNNSDKNKKGKLIIALCGGSIEKINKHIEEAKQIIQENCANNCGNVVFFNLEERETFSKRNFCEDFSALGNNALIIKFTDEIQYGKIALNFTAQRIFSDKFIITVSGQLSHGSAPHLGHDAILAAAATVCALKAALANYINGHDLCDINFMSVDGGLKQNIIADKTIIKGTTVTFNAELRENLPSYIQSIAENTASSYGCSAKCNFDFTEISEANENKHLLSQTEKSAVEIYGSDCLIMQRESLPINNISMPQIEIPCINALLAKDADLLCAKFIARFVKNYFLI